MFEKCFNRLYDFYDFPHFVPREEKEYNAEYAKMIREGDWINRIWNKRKNDAVKNEMVFGEEVRRIMAYDDPLILDICSGPGGGFMPAVLLLGDYNAHVMISDLCPTVPREWQNFFKAQDNPPPNVEYAAFDVYDFPFADNSLDIITGYSAIINIEGGMGDEQVKALREIHRVLKKGGLFVMADQYVAKEYLESLEPDLQKAFLDRDPSIFTDFQDELAVLGYTSIETVDRGTWSNKDDDSGLADFTRKLGTELVFTEYTKYCVK